MNLGQKTDRAVFSFVYFVVKEMRLRENIRVCHKLVCQVWIDLFKCNVVILSLKLLYKKLDESSSRWLCWLLIVFN